MQVQSKKGSFIEACVNTTIGFLISLIANPIICWILGIKANGNQMIGYVGLFTILSVLRSYVIRRWFNKSVENFVNRRLNSRSIPDLYTKEKIGDYQPKEDVVNTNPPYYEMSRADLVVLADIYGVMINPAWSNEIVRQVLHDAFQVNAKSIRTFKCNNKTELDRMVDEIAAKW